MKPICLIFQFYTDILWTRTLYELNNFKNVSNKWPVYTFQFSYEGPLNCYKKYYPVLIRLLDGNVPLFSWPFVVPLNTSTYFLMNISYTQGPLTMMFWDICYPSRTIWLVDFRAKETLRSSNRWVICGQISSKLGNYNFSNIREILIMVISKLHQITTYST